MEGTPLPVESQHPERRPHPSKAASPLNATNFIAGGLAGTTVDLVLYPLDAIKTRLQAVKQLNSTRTSGVRLHYAGLGAAMAASFPAASIFFGFYEGTKLYIMRNKAEGGWAQSVPDWSVPGIAVCMAEGVTSCFRWVVAEGCRQVKSTSESPLKLSSSRCNWECTRHPSVPLVRFTYLEAR
eukprot:GHVN01068434.1.p1 GENE.GHVN01068434.1~~GHVN01068434.1.p1  ORF type:complete len:182 (+),score=20.81 GHVN01068434.1:1076-1621(+)